MSSYISIVNFRKRKKLSENRYKNLFKIKSVDFGGIFGGKPEIKKITH